MDRRARYESLDYGEPGVADGEFVRRLDRWLGPWARYWIRPSWEGTEHLPEHGPYMIVANHSGGGGVEVLCLVLLWWRAFGTTRPIAGFAHPLAWRLPIMSSLVKRLGIVPSTYPAARHAIERGVPLVVFPGGDHEAFRPIWQARRVDFGGRKGFLRIAREHRIPIVPMAIRGSHVTVPIVWRSRLLAWLLIWPRLAGVKRVPVTVLGLVACAACAVVGHAAGGVGLGVLGAWLSWTVIPSPWIAWVPSRVRMRLLPPIPPEELGDDLDLAYARVTGALQAAML